MNETISTKGYGREVKQLATELQSTGVATLDLTDGVTEADWLENRRVRSRATGYAHSLAKIFGRSVFVYSHNPDPETGDRFLALAFE
jgi:hypothetical protein